MDGAGVPTFDLPTQYQQYIHLSRYARWVPDEGRRETWAETNCRYMDWASVHVATHHPAAREDWLAIRHRILAMMLSAAVMPSMRAMMTAGPALNRAHVAGYNCSYLPVDDVRAFSEAMYMLLCGTGVGFSVERQYINKLPVIPKLRQAEDLVIRVEDSKEGWVSAFAELLGLLYSGVIPSDVDLSRIRPAGSRLTTFGGRASGPGPLAELVDFTINLFEARQEDKLRSIDCHDLMCKIGSVVVVGGVRRSAMISLSNLTDERLRVAKMGQFWLDYPHRALSNNSVAYTEMPDTHAFMKEWLSLYDSRSGERGIFNRLAADHVVSQHGRRETGHEWGTNPCSEIILRPHEFCNLTEVVVRPGDTLDNLLWKVECATILGTIQSTLTSFDPRMMRSDWRDNCEDERLLGVSLTGIEDHEVLSRTTGTCASWLRAMRKHAVGVNKAWADKLGIKASAAITCVKPSGTVSQLVNSASGIHPRYAKYYIRRVTGDVNDPLVGFMISRGVPHEYKHGTPSQVLLQFPMQSPDGATTRHDRTALDQLELWKHYQLHWCEHKPSITVYVREREWMRVGAWVYDHFDLMSGVSFLPHSDHVYEQAPYEEISEVEYAKRALAFPQVDWSEYYEEADHTVASQELACVGGACEL